MAEIALITGCASGIGKALALDLHARRLPSGEPAFKVYATDYRYEVVKDLESEGISVLGMDVTNQEAINTAVATIIENEGRIDVCVCNAGISAAGFLAEMDYKNAERLFKVNVHGVFRTIQAVVKPMMDRLSGKIFIMGSTNAYFSPICNGVYSGAKAAVHIMAECLALELKPFFIQVTTVIPGWVKSDIINNAPPSYARYERPGSFYEFTVPALKIGRELGIAHGATTQEAAKDIGDGICKPKQGRYLYTGKMLFYSLFWGYAQLWLRPKGMAETLQKRCRLFECAEKGPRSWEGHFVLPPPPPPEPVAEPASGTVPANGTEPANGAEPPTATDVLAAPGAEPTVLYEEDAPATAPTAPLLEPVGPVTPPRVTRVE